MLNECNNNNVGHKPNNENEGKKHNYVKVQVDAPYDRDIILKVTSKQKENYSADNLNPNRDKGFSDAEAYFGFRIKEWSIKNRLGSYTLFINLHIIDLPLLLDIKKYFKVGNITQNKNSALYKVNSINDIVNVIIPHFYLFFFFDI